MSVSKLIIIIMTRSDQPEPPAVAIVRQNGLSSASRSLSKLHDKNPKMLHATNAFIDIQTVLYKPIAENWNEKNVHILQCCWRHWYWADRFIKFTSKLRRGNCGNEFEPKWSRSHPKSAAVKSALYVHICYFSKYSYFPFNRSMKIHLYSAIVVSESEASTV